MVNLILPGRRHASKTTESEYVKRMKSAAWLAPASKDINQWKITLIGKPQWAPATCDHAMRFYDKKTSLEKIVLIDQNQADENGDYTSEHRRITEAFTRVLLELDEMIKYIQACRLLGVQPDITRLGHGLEVKVRDELWRGDHDAGNSFE